jgi:DNA-binding CsgD family transcriptional regulator/tetratricopeptide (TPR) repeat protein
VAAQVTDRAFAAAVDAAGRAEAVYAPEDALEALELALSLYDRATGEDGEPLEKEISTALQMRAAEAAFAAGRPARAVAYIESLLGSFDERRDRVAVGMLHDRLGRYRRATGDAAGSVAAFERAVELVPPGTTVERATVLASLAQALMLDGTFSEAERRAQEAIELARALGPDGESVLVHATTTLAVSMGWGDDPETGVAMLREARTLAAEAGDHDELFRVYANLTTVLDLVGRRSEAVEVAFEGIEAARRAGLEAVYGNFLRANASDSLFLIGRWPESSAISATALEWSPAGVSFVAPIDSLAVVEIETRAGEYAGRLLGQLLLELETVRAAQHAVPVYRAAASFALWRGDHADARRAAVRGWELIRDTEDWSLIAKMAATVAEVDSAAAADARARRNLADLAGIRSRSQAVVSTARRAVEASGVSSSIGSRREADAWLALTQAHRDRLEGRDDEAAWDRLATAWNGLSNPYEVARARWRQAEAVLGTGEGRAARSRARPALEEAARIAVDLGARPLLREVRELAGRAMIGLPETVDALLNDDEQTLVATMTPAGLAAGTAGAARRAAAAPGNGHSGLVPVGPGDGAGGEDGNRSPLARGVVGETAPVRTDTFGLSRREREVLALIAEGRTNREIGERLFISQKTVGVHVGNILAKLRVSGRVEAAAVAIRLGLTGSGTTGIPIGR